MKCVIYSCYDCLLKSQLWERQLLKNEKFEMGDLPSQIFVYPSRSSKVIPFTIDLSQPSSFYKTVVKDEKQYIFLTDGFFSQTITRHHFSFNGKTSEVEICNKQIVFITKNTKKIISLPPNCKDFKCDSFYHIIYVLFKAKLHHLFAFNTVNGLIKTFEGEEIVQQDNHFSISKNSLKTNIYFDKDGLKLKDKQTSSIMTNPLCVSKNFMEQIKEGEYLSSLSYLSENLLKEQDEKSLQAFFGEVSFIFPLNLHQVFAISDGKEKIYSFQIENGKIVDIID